jgi:Right handed beta helix region
LTTVKKKSQRGLLAAAIILPVILVFYSLGDAQAVEQVVNIPCGQDIDATINNTNAYPRSTPQRFVLTANCPSAYSASATIVPSNGDVVACAAAPTFAQRGERGQAFDPTTRCTVAGNSSVENVFRPIGQGGTTATVRFEGIKITGGNYTGSTGTGAAIAEGSMTNSSTHYGIEVMGNEAAGILSAKGTFERVELTDNTSEPGALGVIGAGMKARNEVEVKNSYIHHTKGNGLWCDNSCQDSPTTTHPKGFWVHDNLVVDNGRAGIRFENVGGSNAGEALIEDNEVSRNSLDEKRSGISVRDAQNATIQNNRFDNNARDVAIMASDSGRSSRPNLLNILIVNNTLNGEIIKGCELPDTIVDCPGYIP